MPITCTLCDATPSKWHMKSKSLFNIKLMAVSKALPVIDLSVDYYYY